MDKCCCCLLTPLTLVCGGETDHPAFGPPASLSLHLASSSITPAGFVHKSRGDSVVRMWVQLKRWWVLQKEHSGDGCDFASTLCRTSPPPAMGSRFTVFLACQPCEPAGWLALLLTKAGDVVCPLQPSSSVNSGCPGPESSILVSSRWACPISSQVTDH